MCHQRAKEVHGPKKQEHHLDQNIGARMRLFAEENRKHSNLRTRKSLRAYLVETRCFRDKEIVVW